MIYGSVSSGIECAAIAWEPLGWSPAFLAEIDPFASHVLHHHHSSGRPRNMPSPEAEGLSEKDRRARRAAIKAVQALPERANGVPNFGDMTTYEDWPDAAIDLLIGGTPCQAWSVAGLRKGLDDPRGDLTLTYAAIARRYRPRWLVWENVFGVLSHDGGRSFASLLGLLSGRRVEVPAGGWKSAGVVEGYSRAYGLAWIVRDTQYVRVDGFERAIPQRRRRVFVVGYLGDWRRAAAVLLEREGLSGDPAPRRRAQEDVAATVAGGARGRGGYSADDIPLTAEAFGGNRTSGPIDVATALTAHGSPNGRMDFESEAFIAQEVAPTLDASYGRLQGASGQDARHGHSHLVPVSVAVRGRDGGAMIEMGDDVAHTIQAAQGGSDKPHVCAPIAYSIMPQNSGKDYKARQVDVAQPLMAGGPVGGNQGGDYILEPIAFNSREDPEVTWDRAGALGASSPQAQAIAYGIDSDCLDRSGEGSGGSAGERSGLGITEGHTNALRAKRPGAVAHGWAVRRLTPRECCRLQGIPADYFDEVIWRGKPAPDGQIYKTLGNGFSANVVRWIGRRIEMVEAVIRDIDAGKGEAC